MKPDLHNYEEYALDYIEGNLSVEDSLAFERFLDQHPEIAEEISGIVPVYAAPDMNTGFPDKEKLKKHEPRVLPLFPFSLNSWTVGVAATLALAAFSFSWIYTGGDDNKGEGIVVEKVEKPVQDHSDDTREPDNLVQAKDENNTEALAGKADGSGSDIRPNNEKIPEADEDKIQAIENKSALLASNDDAGKGVVDQAEGSPVEPIPMVEEGQIAVREADMPVEKGLAQLEVDARGAVRDVDKLEVVPVETEFSLQSAGIAYTEIETVEIGARGEEDKGFNINLPFGLSGKVEADINGLPNSIGKIRKQKLKEALVPSFLSSR